MARVSASPAKSDLSKRAFELFLYMRAMAEMGENTTHFYAACSALESYKLFLAFVRLNFAFS